MILIILIISIILITFLYCACVISSNCDYNDNKKLIGGTSIRKSIKFNNNFYNIKVSTYPNGRLKIYCKNKIDSYEITTNLNKVYLDNDKVFLNPKITSNGLINCLKKYRIIREITNFITINDTYIPVAIINMGKLREYDKLGVKNFLKDRRYFY